MKTYTLICLFMMFVVGTMAQSEKKQKEIIEDSSEAKADFLEKDDGMAKFFNDSYGYVIFPNVGKGGLGIGGAAGNGVAYKQGSLVGMAKLSQVSIGLQAGGQAFREVIFFETQKEFDRFTENKIEFTAQVSAVAAAAGVSANTKYVDGIAIFTMAKGGLMYEASVAGQKFKFDPL
ncbi:YSC84-related protein [Carboxylicivirga sp. RSCT41]|uniref:lipid-binding SYLF domain-containing protein n=1 Tax=Carboxylicivirga agarovorans TaxID=3417570 RepID=UPI003D326FBE